ncbi:MAG: hypothetical protein K0U84_20730 [Actinomycetia bacterium]|nr:hypothetical protein [Actinomycetes bacterium]
MPTKAVLRHVRVETPRTNHQRKCAAHKSGKNAHYILAGDIHLVIVEDDKEIRYCPAAATEILDRIQADLDHLRRQFGVLEQTAPDT